MDVVKSMFGDGVWPGVLFDVALIPFMITLNDVVAKLGILNSRMKDFYDISGCSHASMTLFEGTLQNLFSVLRTILLYRNV